MNPKENIYSWIHTPNVADLYLESLETSLGVRITSVKHYSISA